MNHLPPIRHVIHITIFEIEPTDKILKAVASIFPTQSIQIGVMRLGRFILISSFDDHETVKVQELIDSAAKYLDGITTEYNIECDGQLIKGTPFIYHI